jgi:hypothetical protein
MLALAACSSDPGGSDLPSDAGPRPLGALEIITAHTGSAIDPDGYILVLNGVDFGAMGIADTLLLRNLPQAEYSVGLADVAGNCDNGGGNPRGVSVEGHRTSRVIFQVKCRVPDPSSRS